MAELMTLDDVITDLKSPYCTLLPEALKRVVSTQKVRAGLHAAGAVELFDGDRRVRGTERQKLSMRCIRPERREHYAQISPRHKLFEHYQEMRRGRSGSGRDPDKVVVFKPKK
jgi:hypothetical protein